MRQHLINAKRITDLMDNQFKIGPWRFGLDPLLGLFPGLGDIIPLLLSSYLIWIGWKAKLPSAQLIHMVINILLDFAIGAVPILGDVLDFGFKANVRNLKLLEQHMGIALEPDAS
jgi:hypothetical protein